MMVLGTFIMPHPPIIMRQVGRGQENIIQKTIDACNEIRAKVARLNPDTLVLISPHSVMYADYFHISPGKSATGDLRRFGAAEVEVNVRYDERFASTLAEEFGETAGTLGEKDASLDHGTIIPLSFIKPTCKMVRIGLSGLPLTEHYRLGQCIAKVSDKLNTTVVIIASGDLSHKLTSDGPYGLAAEGIEFDRRITAAMAEGDFLRFMTFNPDFTEAAAECGLRSFVVMAGALDGRDVDSELLSYEGPFGVGYAVASFIPLGANSERRFLDLYTQQEAQRIHSIKSAEDEYVKLARYSLESYVKTGQRVSVPDNLSQALLNRKAGVFVSLKKQGNLRGCIGTIAPITDNVAEEILRNAVSAAIEDPRFDPVCADELDQLVYSVDVLSPAEPITSADSLDVKRYGVIVTSGHKRGLLLPNLNGVDTIEQQISIALQKAGIKPNERYTLERFEVVRHK